MIPFTYQTLYAARLSVLLAEEHQKASLRLEEQTNRLILQTDRLVGFTKGLYWFTVVLLVLGILQFITMCRHP